MSTETIGWATRIALAQQRGRFNGADWRDATTFETCAVAEHAPDFKRNTYGVPLDEVLQALGVDFALAVKADDFKAARKALYAVEHRVREITQSMTEGDN